MYKTKISVYPSCLSTLVHNDVTLSEVYDKIKNDNVLRQRTVNYRKAIEAKLPAKQLKKLKAEQFPMLMPAARFKEGRDMEHLDSYTGLCQCDIDNIPPDMMDEAKRRVRSLPFVCMYHVSMSGNGLHIYYFYQIPNEGLTPQVYQQAFIQGNECIGKAIPADYDAAVGKANHGSSICHDPEAWFNPDAEPFKVDMSLLLKKRGKNDRLANDTAITEKEWSAQWTAEKVFAYAQECVSKSATGEFAHGNRNKFLVRLAMMLSDFGMEQEHAAQLMEQEYASQYGEESIPSLVSGCYKSGAKMHGRRALPDARGKKSGERKGDVKMQIAANFLRNQGLKFDVITHKLKRSDMVDVTDRDINSMLLACNVESCQNISAQTFRSALMSNCIPEFNPLTDYLDEAVKAVTINPDGPSYIDQVAGMVHVTYTPQSPLPPEGGLSSLWHTCFRKWFVSMVASWMDPKVVNHQILVLIGPQGIFKSTWLDALIPETLVSYRCRQSGTNFSDKDEQLRCAEFAMVNYDEFDRLSSSDLDNLKSLITTPDVSIRAPYGSTKERRVRIASYCASGNKFQFLTDQTGNRRFLPFYVEHIDSPFDHPIDHHRLYAEAVKMVKEGFVYWFTTEDIQQLSKYVEQFADRSPEEELLDVYFDIPKAPGVETRTVKFLTSSEIQAKLVSYGNLHRPIPLRTLCQVLDNKGFQRMRSNRKRGYLVVELEATEINSNRIAASGTMPF